MQIPETAFDGGLRLAIAALVGLAVGIEREWSRHVPGGRPRFAGLRTFLIFGLIGGIAGLLSYEGMVAAAATLVGGTTLFIASAYVMAVRRSEDHPDGTTEAAALVVLGLGMLAGAGEMALAAGSVAVVVFALGEKERLHWLVMRIEEAEMRAGLRFLVMALVVLPLLPATSHAWLGGLTLRGLWLIVLLLSGLNFAGYVTRRTIGTAQGYGVTGLLGGLVSSTLVALQFSRVSRRHPEDGEALATGVIGAATVSLIRALAVAGALAPEVARRAAPWLVVPVLIGALPVSRMLRARPAHPGEGEGESRNPLGFWSSIRMTAIFAVALVAMQALRDGWGQAGVLATAVAAGLANVDALALAMSRVATDSGGVTLAVQGLAIGLVATSVLKTAIAAGTGQGVFRREVMLVTLGQALAIGAGWWVLG